MSLKKNSNKINFFAKRFAAKESFAKAVEFGASSIDVEILCYSAERDYSHYTDLKQKLVHRVMEIVRDNGSDFALPSRSVYVESSHEIES